MLLPLWSRGNNSMTQYMSSTCNSITRFLYICRSPININEPPFNNMVAADSVKVIIVH